MRLRLPITPGHAEPTEGLGSRKGALVLAELCRPLSLMRLSLSRGSWLLRADRGLQLRQGLQSGWGLWPSRYGNPLHESEN